MTEKQKAFLERNKYRKNIGKCVICKKPTSWNEEKGRYNRFCSDECVKKYVEIRNKRMLDKYGTTNLASIPEFQKDKLMANRSIAKTYTFKDGGQKIVLSNIEYGILEYLDNKGYTSEEVEAPASVVIPYKFEGKNLNHIPDIFVKPLNLIISGKDGLDNPNMSPHFIKDRKKNIAIFKEILDNWNFNYVQVEGEKEVKALDSTFITIEKLTKKGRVVIPPRIDFALLYSEGWFTPPKYAKEFEGVEFPAFILGSGEKDKYFALPIRNVEDGFAFFIFPPKGYMVTVNLMRYIESDKVQENIEVFYAKGAKMTYDTFKDRTEKESNLYIISKIILGEKFVEEHSIEEWIKALKRKCIHEDYKKAYKKSQEAEDELDKIIEKDSKKDGDKK